MSWVRTRLRGFTLIEVMMAVVILAVGLSSLFTSEAGAMRIAQRARNTTIATLLARCKMAEIEERISKEGFPGAQIDGRDECCDEAEHEGFHCEWKVERISLPDMDDDDAGVKDRIKAGATGGGDSKSSKAGAPGGALAAIGGMAGGAAGGAVGGLGGSGGLGATGGPGGTGGTGGTAGLSGILSSIGATEGTGAGSDPFAAMVMGLTFPVMKPVIEESVRKATVTVTWKEGSGEQKFDVVQFLVNEAPMLPDEDLTDALQTGGGTAGNAGTGTSTTGTTTTPGAAPASTTSLTK